MISDFRYEKRQRTFLILLTAVTVFSLIFFYGKMHYDNKYTAPGPQAVNGVLDLSEYPIGQKDSGVPQTLFLTKGWEFYQYQYLTPEDLHSRPVYPTTYLFLGQYGGFELGDASKSPHGCATYRMTVRTDGVRRSYMLEIPEIYGAYEIWINGDPAAKDAFTVFQAQDSIEIVVAVNDDTHFYSGMIYPPAFGTPSAVWRLLAMRMIFAGILDAVAVFTAVLYFFIALRIKRKKLALAYSTFCLCLAGAVSRGFLNTLAISGDLRYIVERFCYYGAFAALLFILGHVCDMPKVWMKTAKLFACSMWAIVVLFPFVMGDSIEAMLLMSSIVFLYKLGIALCFFLSSVWAWFRGRSYAASVLTCSCIFSCALLADRLMPLYEPILLNWPVETAFFAIMLIVAGVLVRDTIGLYSEKNMLREQKEAALTMAAAQKQQYVALASHLDALREVKHEMRSSLLTLQHYLELGETDKINEMIAHNLGVTELPGSYTANSLVNSVLTVFHHQAREKGIDVTFHINHIPSDLPVEDLDLCSMLTNILRNAQEACEHVPEGRRAIEFSMRIKNSMLFTSCRNSKANDIRVKSGRILTGKRNKQLHGFGLNLIRTVAENYGGAMDIEYGDDYFEIYTSLYLDSSVSLPSEGGPAGLTDSAASADSADSVASTDYEAPPADTAPNSDTGPEAGLGSASERASDAG